MFGKKGFTLLELIIVIIVIGILASIALPRYLQVAEKARLAEGKSILGIVRSAQMRYLSQYGNYSSSAATLDVSITLPKYFQNVTTTGAIESCVAQIERKGGAGADCPTEYCFASDDGYTLNISADGVITCAPPLGGGNCPPLQ